MIGFRANGKLLVTGEYLVIDGAKALALPTKFGQELLVHTSQCEGITWKSLDVDGNCWLEVKFSPTWDVLSSSDSEADTFLVSCIHEARKIGKSMFTQCSIETHLKFPKNWGLGSSSSLICIIAQLFEIDAMELHRKVSSGSGYDIAAGIHNQPILYVNKDEPIVDEVVFDPIFRDQIYFVHLNQKQKSDVEVANYQVIKQQLDLKECCATVTELTDQIMQAITLVRFEELIEQHEAFLSHLLQRETIAELYFSDYTLGAIKSLGAWGGDFILATGNESTPDYFKQKGYNTVLSYSEMILNA